MAADSREQFLIAMYSKMWDNIDRHILVVWQSVGVLTGAFAALILTDKGVMPVDYTTTLVVLVGAWQVAHVLDASWWFNRNLLIVANIERQFLTQTDARDIHFYFIEHRDPTILDHHRIQLAFGISVTIVVLLYHFIKRIYPLLFMGQGTFEVMMAFPYVMVLLSFCVIVLFYRRQREVYCSLRKSSPGKDMSSA